MDERLYTEHPALYDAIHSDWNYDRDVAFLEDRIADCGNGGKRLPEIGCGTGEHTRRFVARGCSVTAIDKYQGMLDRARAKCAADFRRDALPALDTAGTYDAVVMIRGVVNHLFPAALDPAIAAIRERLADDGVLVFDNAPLPKHGNRPDLDVGETEHGPYARVAQHAPRDDGTIEWREVVFPPGGDCFISRRLLTPFDDAALTAVLADAGCSVEPFDGYGTDDRRTVFVATR